MLPNLEKKSSMQKKERTISTQKTRLATPNMTLLSSKKMRQKNEALDHPVKRACLKCLSSVYRYGASRTG